MPFRHTPLPQLMAISIFTPMVMASRMAIMSGPSTAHSRAEHGRMVSEKASAFMESGIAVQMAALRAGWATSQALMFRQTTTSHVMARGVSQITQAMLKPYARRVTANAKRLGRKTLK